VVGAGRHAARPSEGHPTMGTGSYVNFGNGDDAFNIALDSAGT
jgi:hypothetical protein